MMMEFIKKRGRFLWPEFFVARRALSAALAVAVAMLVDRYGSILQTGWVPLVAIMIIQMAIRMNARQVLERALVVCCAVLVISVLFGWLQPFYQKIFVILLFSVMCGFYRLYLGKSSLFSLWLMISVIALIMLVPSFSSQGLYDRMHDVVLGAIVGVVSSVLLFPGRADVDFRQGVIPVLQGYREYLSSISALFFRYPHSEALAQQNKLIVEKVLQEQRAFFPAWVYEFGFNPELQQGHRHFLIRVEQIGQVLFAMHQVARHHIDLTLLRDFQPAVQRAVEQVQAMLTMFVLRLELQKIEHPLDGFGNDLLLLEDTYRNIIRVPLEALDLSQDYIDVAAFIYDLKDLHKLMVKLAEALR